MNNDTNDNNDNGLRGGTTTPLEEGDSRLSSNLFLKQPPSPKKPNPAPTDVKGDSELLIKSILSALLTQSRNQSNFFTYMKSYHKTHLRKLDIIIDEIRESRKDPTLGRSIGATGKAKRRSYPSFRVPAKKYTGLEKQLSSTSASLAKTTGKVAGGLTDALLPLFGGAIGGGISGIVTRIASMVFTPQVLLGAGAFAGSYLITRKILEKFDKDHVIDKFMQKNVWDKLPELKIGNFKVGEKVDKGLQKVYNWGRKQWTGEDINADITTDKHKQTMDKLIKEGKITVDASGKVTRVNKPAQAPNVALANDKWFKKLIPTAQEYVRINNIKMVDITTLGLKGGISNNSVPCINANYVNALKDLDKQLYKWGYAVLYTSCMGSNLHKGHDDVKKISDRSHYAGAKIDLVTTNKKISNEHMKILEQHNFWDKTGAKTGALGWEIHHYDFALKGTKPFSSSTSSGNGVLDSDLKGSPTGYASPVSLSNILDSSKGSNASGMSMSKEGLHALKNEEGVRTEAYKDSRGIWTIGVGHTGKVNGQSIHAGMKITNDQVDQLLKGDIKRAEDYVRKNVKVPITQEMFDALVSYVFNVGSCPKLMAKLNSGDYKGAMAEIQTINPELNKRRGREQAMFAKGIARMEQTGNTTVASAPSTVTPSSAFISSTYSPSGINPAESQKIAMTTPQPAQNVGGEKSSIGIEDLRLIEGFLQQ